MGAQDNFYIGCTIGRLAMHIAELSAMLICEYSITKSRRHMTNASRKDGTTDYGDIRTHWAKLQSIALKKNSKTTETTNKRNVF